MALRKFRKVKYRVTGAFADKAEGEITTAYVLLEDSCGGAALLYHPKGDIRGFCASIEMAHEGRYGIYESCDSSYDAYINIESQADINAIVRNASKLKYKETK